MTKVLDKMVDTVPCSAEKEAILCRGFLIYDLDEGDYCEMLNVVLLDFYSQRP